MNFLAAAKKSIGSVESIPLDEKPKTRAIPSKSAKTALGGGSVKSAKSKQLQPSASSTDSTRKNQEEKKDSTSKPANSNNNRNKRKEKAQSEGKSTKNKPPVKKNESSAELLFVRTDDYVTEDGRPMNYLAALKNQAPKEEPEVFTLRNAVNINLLKHIPRSIMFPSQSGENVDRQSQFLDFLLHSEVSSKSNGYRYVCIVYIDLQCELIASEYMSSMFNTSNDVLLMLDCELVTLMTSNTTANLPMNVNNEAENVLVVYDVFTPTEMSTKEKLTALQVLLWDGYCKQCGCCHREQTTTIAKPESTRSNPHTCYFGIQLKHHLFSRVMIKRMIPFHLLRSFHIGNTSTDHVYANKDMTKFSDIEEIPLLPLHDGLILDCAEDVDEHLGDNVYRSKWGNNMTLDVYVRSKALKPSNNKDEEEEKKAAVVGDGGLHTYLLNADGIYKPTKHPVHFPPNFNARDVVVECMFDMTAMRWLFVRLRKDKLLPNTIFHEEKILQALEEEQAFLKSKKDENGKHASSLYSIRNAFVESQYKAYAEKVNIPWNHAWTLSDVEREEVSLPSSSTNVQKHVSKLFWNTKRVANAQWMKQLPQYQPPDAASLYCALSERSHPLSRMFAYHDRVKSFLYSLFQGRTVLDIGPGKCANRFEMQHFFRQCICIEKNPCFVDHLKGDTRLNKNVLQVLSADAGDVGLHSDIHRLLLSADNDANNANHSVADCCFAFFSLQGVCTSESSLRNFLRNIAPNLHDTNGYLMAILPQSKDIPTTGIQVTSTLEKNRVIFELTPTASSRSWLGGKEIQFFSAVYGDITTEQLVEDLSDASSIFHQVMEEEGFDLLRVVPLDIFHWWMSNAHDHVAYDTMTAIERQISACYRCVIWRKAAGGGGGSSATTAASMRSTASSSACTVSSMTALQTTQASIFSRAPWDLLQRIFDYMDIPAHLNLAHTCTSMLRFYLIGNTQSFYSRELIGSYRPLTSILFGMYEYSEERWMNDGAQMYYLRSLLLPVVNAFLMSFPCMQGCAFCTCHREEYVLRTLHATSTRQVTVSEIRQDNHIPGVPYTIRRRPYSYMDSTHLHGCVHRCRCAFCVLLRNADYHQYNDIPHALRRTSHSDQDGGNPYATYCNEAIKHSIHTWHQLHPFAQEKGNVFTLLILKSLFVGNTSLDAVWQKPSRSSSSSASSSVSTTVEPLLSPSEILEKKSLFKKPLTSFDFTFPRNDEQQQDDWWYDDEEDRIRAIVPLEKQMKQTVQRRRRLSSLLTTIVPELFADGVWYRESTAHALQSIRAALDDVCFHPLLAIDYVNKPDIHITGGGYGSRGYWVDLEKRYDTSSPIAREEARQKVVEVVKAHRSWRERWLAFQLGCFKGGKQDHQYQSDGSFEATNFSPFATSFW